MRRIRESAAPNATAEELTLSAEEVDAPTDTVGSQWTYWGG